MKRSPIRRVSKKRQAENARRKQMMLDKFGPKDTWRCQLADLIGTPCHGAIAGHELLKRSRGGSIVDPDNVVLACTVHNDWVEDHPTEAHELRLAIHSWESKDDEDSF